MFDKKKIMVSSTFEDGVWTTTTEAEGCMTIVNIAKLEGDVMHVTEKYNDVEIHKTSTRWQNA